MRGIAPVQLLVFFFLLCTFFRRGFCCENGWLQYGEHCFRIYTSPLPKSMASLRCIMEGSSLVSISSNSTLNYITLQSSHVRGDRFWVGLQRHPDSRRLEWLDGTSAMEEPWVQHPDNSTNPFDSTHLDCFAFNGALVVKVSCIERMGFICGHKQENTTTTRAVCNWRVNRDHSFIGKTTGNCLFRAPGTTTKDKAEELCVENEGHFLDLNDIMKDGLTALHDHKVLPNDGSRYWTSMTWNGTNLIWTDSATEDLSVLFINGTGSCITVQFNFTDVLETHLYQTECNSEASVVCSKTADASLSSTTTEGAMNDGAMLSCPPGYNWKSDAVSGFCYWETSFETERLPWEEAERYCQSYGGHLSSFHSVEEEKIGLSFQYGILQHPNWIGLKLDNKTETYKWSDGTVLDYQNWAPGHPDHRDKRLRCVAMDAKDKNWVSSLCGIHSWFICKAPKRPNPPAPVVPTPVPLQPCSTYLGYPGLKAYYFEGSCYFTVSESFNWHRAKQYCENEGATLVSIHSDGEVGFLLKMLHESVTDNSRVWIGLNALGADDGFHWSDWTPVDFTYFSKDEPNNFQNQEKCCNMYVSTGEWNDENCNAQMGFVCKRGINATGSTVIPSTIDPTVGHCKKGWISYHDRCYFLGGKHEKDRVNWTEASDICVDQGGYLTSIRDEKEQGFLSYLLQSLGVDAWIGLHDTIQSGRYYWVDNSDVQYTNWAPGEPSFFGIKEDCVKMVFNTMDSGVWKDEECVRKMGYICVARKDPNLPEPSLDSGISCLHPPGWVKLDSMCFKMFAGNTLTWSEAEAACTRDGAHLVSVSDKGVKAVLSYLAAEVKKPFWIGLKYEESTQTLKWLNDWPIALTNWEKNEPSFMKNDVCIASTSEGYWKKSDCTEQMPYVCQITSGKPTKQTQYSGECPTTADRWKPGSGSYCYILEKDFRNDWFTANLVCFRYGSQLASIHSKEELESLKEIMPPGIQSMFIGLLRNKKGGFSWTDDTPVNFVNWDEGEPENFDDQCVEMMADTMKWRVTSCIVKRHFICQNTKVDLAPDDYTSEKQVDTEPSSGLSTSAVIAIVACIALILLVAVIAAIYFYKNSARKPRFSRPLRQDSVSFENALYHVDSASMEFQDEEKCSL